MHSAMRTASASRSHGCQLLNISKRTLQTLRGNGSLSYTQINHKIYYRAEDVRSFLAVLEAHRRHEQKRRNGV